jgi:deoxycytidylate deaminase
MKFGPCVKQRVFCTIVHPDGQRWHGENSCRNAQTICPRADLPTGQGYELCRDICQQLGHAEVVAAAAAGQDARGGTAYIEGHTYACEPCTATLAAVGVTEIVIGAPPPLVAA